MAESLAGRYGLVTGASSGIGRAIALALADAGVSVWASGRRTEALERLAGEAPDGRIQPLPGDLADRQVVARMAERIGREGRLDLLVHAAAVYAATPVAELEAEELADMMAVNVVAPHVLSRSLLPLLRATHGQIVFLNSSVSRTGGSGPAAYAAAKHAQRGYADVLRGEVNRQGIKVISIFLGRTATPLQERIHALEGRPYHPERLIQPADVARVVLDVVSLPDTVEATDVALRPMQPPLGSAT